jgi:hypothetical protein
MHFSLKSYTPPNFTALAAVPNALLLPATADMVAPENYHATAIFPEYFKVEGKWLHCLGHGPRLHL